MVQTLEIQKIWIGEAEKLLEKASTRANGRRFRCRRTPMDKRSDFIPKWYKDIISITMISLIG